MKLKIALPALLFSIITPAFSSSPLLNKQQVTALMHQIHLSATPAKHHQQNPILHWQRTGETPFSYNDFIIVPMKGKSSVLLAYKTRKENTIYESIDNGQHWTLITSLPHVWSIHDVIALDENKLMLSADNAIYLSPDQGKHWQLWTSSDEMDFYTLLARDNKTIFCNQSADPERSDSYVGLYRTTNNAKSWVPLSLGLPDFQLDPPVKTNQHELLILASTLGGDSMLYYSDNNGDRWQHPSVWDNLTITNFDIDSKQNVYIVSDNKLYITSPDKTTKHQINLNGRCFLFAIDEYDTLYTIAQDYTDGTQRLYRSFDHGETWQKLSEFSIDTMIQKLSISDNGKIILLTNKDMIESDNTQLVFQHHSLPGNATSSYMFKTLALDDTHYYSMADMDVMYSSHDAGQTWKRTKVNHTDTDISDIAIFNGQVLVLASPGNYSDSTLYASSDKGATWRKIRPFHTDVHGKDNKLFAQNGGLVVNAGSGYSFFTQDLINWNPINLDFDQLITYFDGKTLYATNGNWVKSSNDLAHTWTPLLDDLQGDARGISGYQHGVIIAMNHAGVLKSNDGINWQLFNTDFDDYAFHDILALNDKQYLLSSNAGIYYSQDGGEDWSLENDGLTSVQTYGLSALNNLILTSVYEHGVFKTQVPG